MTSKKDINYKGSGIYFKKALSKYKKENFVRVDLGEFENKDEAHFWEGFYIKHYKTHISQGGYNLSWSGGTNFKDGFHHTEDSKMKISISQTGRESPMKGKRHTEISKEKNRIKHLGNKNTLGKHWNLNEETKMKISINNGKGMLGKKLSDETKRKISISQLKRHWYEQ